MATYEQYRYFSEIADLALDAAMELELIACGKSGGGSRGGELLALLSATVNDASWDVLAVDSLQRMHAATSGTDIGSVRTVGDLVEAFRGWMSRLEGAVLHREELAPVKAELLAIHETALSFTAEARAAEEMPERVI